MRSGAHFQDQASCQIGRTSSVRNSLQQQALLNVVDNNTHAEPEILRLPQLRSRIDRQHFVTGLDEALAQF